MITTQLPFHGFYESKWSGAIDDEERYEIDRLIEEHGYDEEIVSDIDVWRYGKYCWMYQNLASDYVGFFNDWFKDSFGVDLELKFDGLESPREYNFTTDRIFAKMPDEKFRELMQLVDIGKLREYVKRNHSSRDGFISFYSNDLDDWLEKLDEGKFDWDHNEMLTLIEAVIDDEYDEYDEYEWAIYGAMQEQGCFYTAFSEHFDWDGFKEEYNEKKKEKDDDVLSEHTAEDEPIGC